MFIDFVEIETEPALANGKSKVLVRPTGIGLSGTAPSP